MPSTCVPKKCFLRTSTEVDYVEGSCGFKRLLKSIIFTIFWLVPCCYVCSSSPAVPPPVCKQISHRSLWGQSALCHLQTLQALQRGQPRCSHLCQEIKSNQITFIVISPQHMCLSEWNSWERNPDSAETIYIYSVHIVYILRHTYSYQYTLCTHSTLCTHIYTQYAKVQQILHRPDKQCHGCALHGIQW